MQRTREDWVKAGLQRLAEAGIHEVRVEPLARALQISKGSFYHYFKDRKELLDAMIDYWESDATTRILRELEKEHFTLEQLFELTIHQNKSMEAAVYEWARQDPAVASRLEAIEEQRMNGISLLYQRKGLPPSEAKDRARLVYFTYVGWIVRFKAYAHVDAKKLFKLLLAL
ncbi:TetR/AcrR family transcriptional regulator [Paenibacillus sp. P26]|nr:TetR/AcrR family transcriptional regulator [Paenibacillus sp. P26]UUZ92029.1 TetR/AcrR family transcriptional regulator [Paenibacillus sp. P25]